MKKIREWVGRLSVRRKIIFYGYLTLTPVLIVVSLVLLLYNYQSEMVKQQNSNIENVRSLGESIEMLQSDVKDISTYLAVNTQVRNLLTADDAETVNMDARVWQNQTPMNLVQDMISVKGHIKTIAIYSERGIRPYLRGMDNSVYLADMETVRESPVYQKTLESENGILWTGVKKDDHTVYESSRNDKVVLCREIYDLARRNKLGYIVIGVQEEYFRNLCSNILTNESESVIILDPHGDELSRVGEVDPAIDEFFSEIDFRTMDYQQNPHSFRVGMYDILCSQLNENSSIICKITPVYTFGMMAASSIYIPFIVLFGTLLGLLPLLMIIANAITKPLIPLRHAITKFSKGDFEQQVEVTTQDEVGEVARCFNKMVVDIRELIEQNYVITLQEKESELSALQAQINPHFLYNTLDSLYWQAMESDNEQIAENVLALSQLFRLVLNQGRGEVSVKQEVELVSRYLQIQKFRFEKRLNYEICVDENMHDKKIPKLILQPFVENAVVHGFENAGDDFLLKIRGTLQEDKIHFEIADNGVGMSEEQITGILAEEPDAYRKQRIGRYAIKNIRDRLELKYHDDCKLEINSQVGQGTIVILEIPAEDFYE